MKKKHYLVIIAALTAIFSSCTTVCPANEGQSVFIYEEETKSVTKKVADYNSVVVLGYNSSHGLDTENLDEYMGSKKLTLAETNKALLSGEITADSISFDDGSIPFPVGNKINEYDRNLLEELQASRFSLIDKDSLLSTAAYQKVSEVNRDEKFIEAGMVPFAVAEDYHMTYDRSQFDGKETVVNNFKKSLEESGADFGIIVVEKPYVRVHNSHGLVEEYMTKCTPYYTVATRNSYYLIRPKTMNQTLFEQTIIAESDTRHYLENSEENPFTRKSIYTQEMIAEDQKNWLTDMDEASKKANHAFVEWLDSLKE